MMIHRAAVLGIALLTTGCFAATEIRASSRTQLSKQSSRVSLEEPEQDAARRISELFSKRGFPLTDRAPDQGGGTVYTFKGNRSSVTVVSGGRSYVSGSSSTLGSIFYARLSAQGQATLIEMLGRPTVDGRVACSDETETWVGGCEPIVVGGLWPGLDQTTGREEAEVIRGIILELEMNAKVSQAPEAAIAPPSPSGPPKHRCVASELPAWKTASPVEKKKLLDYCRAPAAPEGGAGAASP